MSASSASPISSSAASGTSFTIHPGADSASPSVLVDINRIPGLSYLREDDQIHRLRIGACTRHAEIERSELIRTRYPLLSDAAAGIGDPQVRNRGTIGGSLAHGDPASDWP